jgi:hypothetical protein
MRRSLLRRRHRVLRYRAPRWVLPVVAGLVAVVATVAAITGLALIGSVVVGTLLVAWLAMALRLVRPQPAGPVGGGDGPTPPGGAGVREPRRPLPMAPAGAAALPLPDDEDPRRGLAALA